MICMRQAGCMVECGTTLGMAHMVDRYGAGGLTALKLMGVVRRIMLKCGC